MDAWVYLLSKFSHEALLFQGFLIFIGICGYAIFYLTRKRKYGVAGKNVPDNVVKHYLAQLVLDAEEMRTQLFGLLGKNEIDSNFALRASAPSVPMPPLPSSEPSSTAAPATADPRLQEKLRELEKRLAEQANALDAVLNEKMGLEEELAAARAEVRDAATEATPAGDGADHSNALQERVKQLEAQLAEYAIIEDDLANLKRLQKENKALKQQLADLSENPGPSLSPSAPEPAVTKTQEASPSDSESPAPEASATESPDFEALVDVVEKNLAESSPAGEAGDAPRVESENESSSAAQAPNPAGENQTEASGDGNQESAKSEEQLQADFEKMLNS